MKRELRVRPSFVIFAGALVALAIHAQSPIVVAQAPANIFFAPGRNVNTVGPIPDGPNPNFAGNPRHKQRNEASCDVSPNNPLIILCANNDYRGTEQFGDSWIGLSTSIDGGLTWRSRLLEGFPSLPSGVGAADPVVRIVPGLGLINYITVSADERGTLSLALLAERNKENGEPFQFLESRLIGNGTPGRFNDKPAMTAVLNEAGGFIDVRGRRIPRGVVHVGYSLFPGNDNNSSSQIFHLMSFDYGLTWTSPRKLSESLGINQGVDLAVSGDTIVATWRQVVDTNQSDGIAFAVSTNGGGTWSKPALLWSAANQFLDQDTSPLQFRTRSMPTILHDGSAFHTFWAARGFASHPDDARIVVSSSRDGSHWSRPTAVTSYAGRGHQIMPQAAVAGGRIQLNWIDTRNNEPGSFDRTISDFGMDAAGNRVPLGDASRPPAFIYRQSGDIFGAQASAAAQTGQPVLSFTGATQISRYRFGLVNGVRRQLEYNFLNARMFRRGDWPFHGDYHSVAGQRYRPSETTPGAWIRNTAPSTSHAVFYSAFTDNRDVQGYVWAGPPATSFTPSATLQGESGTEVPVTCVPSSGTTPDITVWTASDSPRSRYQNIYGAATLPGLIVATPSGSKPTAGMERAYVLFVRNLTAEDRSYRFTIANQPGDALGRASFRKDDPAVPSTGCVDGAGCTTLDVPIPRTSSVTRTVYVRSSQPRPRITVRVAEQAGGGQTGSVILNSNPDIAEIENPDGGLPNILELEVYQPDILQRQSTLFSTGLVNPDVTPVEGIENPRIEYPRIEYPRIEYPRIEYPRIEYPRIEYDPLGNPRIEYPRIEYPRIEYSSVENPRIEYSPLSSDDVGSGTVAVTEVTWPVTTDGANTTTAMSAKVFVNGTLTGVTGAQMLVSVPHFASVTRTCGGDPVTTIENQVFVNSVVDLASLARTPGGPDTVNPPVAQPTFFVHPNQVVYVTLRLIGRADALLARRAGIIVRAHADASDGDATDEDEDEGFVDVTPPVINLGSLSTGLTVEGNRTGGADVGFVVTATDDSGEPSISCVRVMLPGTTATPVPADGTPSFFALGSWQITCTATDPGGHQTVAGFPVVVRDSTPPTIDASALQISLSFTTNGAIATYSTSSVVTTDVVDSSPTVVCSPASGAFFPLGTGQVTCTATDDSGNSSSAIRSFGIVDTVPPVLTVPGPMVVEATSAAGAVVTFAAVATDIVDPSPTVTCIPPSGSTFALGTTTTVSCTARDASGNVAGPRTFTITVRDTLPPNSLTATVTPQILWPPNGAIVQVTVSGSASDAGSGVARIEWQVIDEYRQHQPSGAVSVPGNGPFSFQVPLLADRRGNDQNGRHYQIRLVAVDAFGNRLALGQALVVNVHDQAGM